MNAEEQIKLARTARLRLKEFQAFFRKFRKKPGAEIDEIFHSVHDEVFSHTDCTTCGNCCKTGTPVFSNKDIERISTSLKIRPGEFVKIYLKTDAEGDLVLQKTPCPFLGSDNLCSVYESRPEDCRNFPHTRRKQMGSKINVILTNTAVCPAAMEIIVKISTP